MFGHLNTTNENLFTTLEEKLTDGYILSVHFML